MDTSIHISSEGVQVPLLLQDGTRLVKVSKKKGAREKIFKLDGDQGCLLWRSKKSGIISVENIRELRPGTNARNYREECKIPPNQEDRWLTIVYILQAEYKMVHLIAPTVDIFNMLYSSLKVLQQLRLDLITGITDDAERRKMLWERHYWKGADEHGNGRLEFDQVKKLCRRLNVPWSKEDIRARFDATDKQKRGYLDFADFQAFIKDLKRRPDVESIYRTYAPNGTIGFDMFEKFMKDVQKSNLDRTELESIFKKYASPSSAASPQPLMSLDGFSDFLSSSKNGTFSDHHNKVFHDMTQPLSHYYIASSHNTYLVGNQLMGDSTTEGYIRALLEGCRSVEMDIYDGPTEPVITHGNTLTSDLSLRSICEAIAKYAFVASHYPVIISAEVHCAIEQQALVASIFRTAFGQLLVTAPLEPNSKIAQLPSPEALSYRILLKAKNHIVNQLDQSGPNNNSAVPPPSPSKPKGKFDKAVDMVERVAKKVVSRPSSPAPATPNQSQEKPKMSMDLVSLIIYTVGVTFRGLGRSISYGTEQIFSLSESDGQKVVDENPLELVKHTVNHLVRVYPKGTRVDSSNYEPHCFWVVGAQLVTVNWQTFDRGYMIARAMFQRNGKSGYVLKPPMLRAPPDQLKLGKRTHHTLDVTIISAQQLPRATDDSGREIVGKSTDDPFVEVILHVPEWPGSSSSSVGSPLSSPSVSSSKDVQHKTPTVWNNGFNPVWNYKLSIPFEAVEGLLELVFVTFQVKDSDIDRDRKIGSYCISLGCLESGYRYLPLHDRQMSQYFFSTLFIHTQILTA